MDIQFPPCKIAKFYTYRTALVHGFCIEDDKDHTLWNRVYRFVEERNGYHMDNHICFTTENNQNFMWSDGKLVIGSLTIRNW